MCLRKDSLCYFNTRIFPMFFFMFSPCRRRTAGRPPITAKIRMVCPLKALHCTSVSPPHRNILPNRLFCRWKRLIFVEGKKLGRQTCFYTSLAPLIFLRCFPPLSIRFLVCIPHHLKIKASMKFISAGKMVLLSYALSGTKTSIL